MKSCPRVSIDPIFRQAGCFCLSLLAIIIFFSVCASKLSYYVHHQQSIDGVITDHQLTNITCGSSDCDPETKVCIPDSWDCWQVNWTYAYLVKEKDYYDTVHKRFEKHYQEALAYYEDHSPGMKVTVYYETDDPQKHSLSYNSLYVNWIIFLVFATLCFIFAIIGMIIWAYQLYRQQGRSGYYQI